MQMKTATEQSIESRGSEDNNGRIRKHYREQRCVIKDQG